MIIIIFFTEMWKLLLQARPGDSGEEIMDPRRQPYIPFKIGRRFGAACRLY
jgi:hypothetical protein